MVNLTTLAPDIVAAILDETLAPEVTLFELAAGTPALWEEQWGNVRGNDDSSCGAFCLETPGPDRIPLIVLFVMIRVRRGDQLLSP